MQMRTIVGALVIGWALTHPALAQSQADMNAGASADYKKADAALNQVYAKLMAKISDAGKAKLRTAQRAWIAFRDSECAFETAGSADGSIHPMVYSGCLAALTKERVPQLQAQLNCQEGDTSCGGQ